MKKQHSQLGKAVIQALKDIKNGRFTVIKRENIDRDTKKLFQEKCENLQQRKWSSGCGR